MVKRILFQDARLMLHGVWKRNDGDQGENEAHSY